MVLAKDPIKEAKYRLSATRRYVRWEKKIALKEGVVRFVKGVFIYLYLRVEIIENRQDEKKT